MPYPVNPFDAFKEFRRNRVIRAALGTTHPDSVRLPESDRTIAIDPHDARVRKILLYDPLRGRVKTNLSFWRTAVAAFEPTVCLDIGLNYGECLFGTDYPEDVVGHGFEANSRLLPYLERSHAGHPQADRLQVHHAAVSDVEGEDVTFVVDPQWSGKSHLSAGGTDDTRNTQTVRTTTIDERVPRPTADDRLLFKIDVEGFEPPVLQGMLKTLESAGSSLGFVEFDPPVLRERGQDVAAYWSAIAGLFDVYRCSAPGEATPVRSADWASAAAEIVVPHCDLILCSRTASSGHAALLAAWAGYRTEAA